MHPFLSQPETENRSLAHQDNPPLFTRYNSRSSHIRRARPDAKIVDFPAQRRLPRVEDRDVLRAIPEHVPVDAARVDGGRVVEVWRVGVLIVVEILIRRYGVSLVSSTMLMHFWGGTWTGAEHGLVHVGVKCVPRTRKPHSCSWQDSTRCSSLADC